MCARAPDARRARAGLPPPLPPSLSNKRVRARQKRDALVQAYTGSGKSLSFLIPLFAVLEEERGIDKSKRRLAGVQVTSRVKLSIKNRENGY